MAKAFFLLDEINWIKKAELDQNLIEFGSAKSYL
ncbi:hypothetical protein VISI1226_10049 [Vibrio sinaloensis DSM 21326]|uniref:Uncharacterized protein n=1 Tax=Vibrio sinaloensis DSM 21326 TaxID=945550 RepID=E8M878_PHOS4|nr:hypothetical protein VISI1226_10049 [Vibrio sinaloensis DSM 21326]